MSEEEDHTPPQSLSFVKLMNDLDIDQKLKSAAQKGDTELVKELLYDGAQVTLDEVFLELNKLILQENQLVS